MKAISLLLSALCLLVSNAFAADSPVGTWTTIDDATHKPRSIIQISENNGVLSGTITKIFKQAGDTGICGKCPGQFKDQPIVGLTILWDLKPDGTDSWGGGQILDPKNGRIYRCKMKLNTSGNSLDVRGYIGISILGRTQTWLRN